MGKCNTFRLIVTIDKNKINPILSNRVVTRGPLTNAGSRFNPFSAIGNKVPKVTAVMVLAAITNPATTATQRSSPGVQINASTIIIVPKANAVPNPAIHSLRRIVQVSSGDTSPTPNERIVTVKA